MTLKRQDATNTPPPVAVTMRLPQGLKSQADAYAEGLGISLNALLAISLREYLDGRRSVVNPVVAEEIAPREPPSQDVEVLESVSVPSSRTLPERGKVQSLVDLAMEDGAVVTVRSKAPSPVYAAPLNPKWNCPCGSKKPWSKCHGRARKP